MPSCGCAARPLDPVIESCCAADAGADSSAVQSRRWRELGMFIALRYLVTVRRATVRPCFASSLTSSSSLIGMLLVFVIDDFLQLQAHRVPGHFLAVGADGAAAEEPLQRKDAARRLDPLVVHRPADGGHVHAHLVGDLLHLQRLDELGPLAQELGLVIDDRLGHAGQRVAALLDRIDQPLGRVDLPLDVFAGFRRRCPAR